MDEVECTCGWSGFAEELVCSEEDDKSDKRVEDIKFNVCPSCGESDGITDIEE